MQEKINNQILQNYGFLEDMYEDSYYPSHLVDGIKTALIGMCLVIEESKPTTLDELYVISKVATEKINELEDAFFEHDSEIETIAAEIIALEFEFIATTYGFRADAEELISYRNW